MITQGSKEHPVVLNDFIFGESLKEVHWPPGINILEIDYPNDSDYEITTPSDLVPAKGAYKVGDKVDKSLVTKSNFGILGVDFDEGNPVGGEIGGNWKTGFLYDVPRLWSIPTIPIVDGITPNPFHDSDQHAMDIWHDWWVKVAQDLLTNGNTGLPDAEAGFQKLHEKTRFLTVSSFSEFEPTPKDGWGTRDYFYNNLDNLEYISQVFGGISGGEFIKETLDLSLVWNYFETNLSTGTGGFSFTINLKPQQGTLIVGQFWISIDTNKDVWLINTKKLETPGSITLFNSTKGSADIANATFTYKSGISGDFTVDKGRILTTGTPKKITTKIVPMTGASDRVLTKFDANGFVD